MSGLKEKLYSKTMKSRNLDSKKSQQESSKLSEIEEKVKNIYSSGIEWVPKNTINLSVEQSKKVIEILELLEENEDVQNTFANCKLDEN